LGRNEEFSPYKGWEEKESSGTGLKHTKELPTNLGCHCGGGQLSGGVP